jgi:hypothetical protein
LQELSSFEEDVEDLRIICENSGTIQTERSESHKLSTPEKISKQLPRMQKDIEALRAIYSTSDPSQAEQGNGTDSKKSLDDGEILPKLSKIKEEIKYLRSSCKKLGITSLNREEVLRELLDIKEDIEDLRQIKDIRDELNMMDSIFRTQDVVIEEMDRITQSWEGQNGIKTISHEVPNRRLVSPYHQHPVVERNLAEVKRLDDFAEKAKEAVGQPVPLNSDYTS